MIDGNGNPFVRATFGNGTPAQTHYPNTDSGWIPGTSASIVLNYPWQGGSGTYNVSINLNGIIGEVCSAPNNFNGEPSSNWY